MTNTNQTEQKHAKDRAKSARPAAPPKRVTKKDQLIRLLSARVGADIASISQKLGWQTHTTRAALTGLRKAGYNLAAERAANGKPARYKITAAPSDATPARAEAVADAG